MPITRHRNSLMYRTGTTKPTDNPRQQRHSLYRELHPEMFSSASPKPTRRTPTGQKVYDWLKEHGPATGRQVAEGLGVHAESVHSTLSHNVIGVRNVDTIKDKDGRKIKVWGIVEEDE